MAINKIFKLHANPSNQIMQICHRIKAIYEKMSFLMTSDKKILKGRQFQAEIDRFKVNQNPIHLL